MATIIPFKAWRYNKHLNSQLAKLTASLRETLPAQRQKLFYTRPYHYYHLASPADVPPYENIVRRRRNWQLDEVIVQDEQAGLYVYRQIFCLHESEALRERIGIIALVKAHEYAEKIILPHEVTIEKAVEYRAALLEHTKLHTIPTHGFYKDVNCSIEKYLHQSIAKPIYEIKDKQGVMHQLSKIEDNSVINLIQQHIAEKQIWIADGHHRYEASLEHIKNNKNKPEKNNELLPYHLMWLTNTESSELGILPTHRIIQNMDNFKEHIFLEKIHQYFEVEVFPKHLELGFAPCENLHTFLLLLRDNYYKICLKASAIEAYHSDLPQEVKDLDVSVLDYFILRECLGLEGQAKFEYLDFTQYLSVCEQAVQTGKAQAAIITRRITAEEIERVVQNGHTMPAKTTYFFPKVLGGMLFADA